LRADGEHQGPAQLWDRHSSCLLSGDGEQLEIAAHNGYGPETLDRWSSFVLRVPPA